MTVKIDGSSSKKKYMVGTLICLTKECNLDMYNKTKSEQHALIDVLDDGNEKYNRY
jgi:hypothetical protein